jgi:hydrogenase nickel incorporation protein HypA/HybF
MMHELSIAESIAEAVQSRAVQVKASRVKSVRLRIGEASGVVADSLSFCFEMIASLEPLLAGAQLQVDLVPHRARCRRCARDFHIEDFIAQCPDCASWETEVLAGTELQLVEIEIEGQSEAELTTRQRVAGATDL